MSRRGRSFPALSNMLIPSSSIAAFACLVGLDKPLNTAVSPVPAFSPLIPLLARIPIATDTSSMLYPSDPARGATYLNVSPIMLTFVFEFDDAAASTSAKCPESAACSPNAVSASVTMSETRPKSSPDAAARSMMPLMPEIISPDFQPAIAMYSNALPASDAENDVDAPISFAFSVSASSSAPVAPEIAATVLICA